MAEATEFLVGLLRPPFRRAGVVAEIAAARDRGEGRLPDQIQTCFGPFAPDFLSIQGSRPEDNRIVGKELEKGRARSFFLTGLKEVSLGRNHGAHGIGWSLRAETCDSGQENCYDPEHAQHCLKRVLRCQETNVEAFLLRRFE